MVNVYLKPVKTQLSIFDRTLSLLPFIIFNKEKIAIKGVDFKTRILHFGLVELHFLLKGHNSTLVLKLGKYPLYSKCRNDFILC